MPLATTKRDLMECISKLTHTDMMAAADDMADSLRAAKEEGNPWPLDHGHEVAAFLSSWAENAIEESKPAKVEPIKKTA